MPFFFFFLNISCRLPEILDNHFSLPNVTFEIKYLHNWFYNKKIIPLTAEEATDLANPPPVPGVGYDTGGKTGI